MGTAVVVGFALLIGNKDLGGESVTPASTRPASGGDVRSAVQVDDLLTELLNSAHKRTVTQCRKGPKKWSDELSHCQWNLRNDGWEWRLWTMRNLGGRYWFTRETMPKGEDINAEGAWEVTKGQGVRVAVVDYPVDFRHEDLKDNVDVEASPGLTESVVENSPYSHGTAMASVIAARDNETGIRGVAPRATVVSYDITYWQLRWQSSSFFSGDASSLAVASHSYGRLNHARPWRSPSTRLDASLSEGFGGRGLLNVMSGGRDEGGSYGPLNEDFSYPGIVPVCSVNKAGKRPVGGLPSKAGPHLWLCAPVHGTVVADTDDTYSHTGGTSPSVPTAQVAGVAALVRSVDGKLSWRDTKLILADSARKNAPADASWATGAAKYSSSDAQYSYSHLFGFGVVDATAAVQLAQNWTYLPAYRTEKHRTNSFATVTVPDDGTAVSRTITVDGDIDFAEYVEAHLDLKAPFFRDLRVELLSPSGAKSVLAIPLEGTNLYPEADCKEADECGITGWFRFGTAAHLGEDPSGTWTLRVVDEKANGHTAQLRNWALHVYGHRSTDPSPRFADDGAPPSTVSFATGSSSASEEAGSLDADVVVEVSPARAADLTVNYSVSGTATAGDDYEELDGSVTIWAGTTSATVTVTALDDQIDDDAETVVLTLTGGDRYSIGTQAAVTVTIDDDDLPCAQRSPGDAVTVGEVTGWRDGHSGAAHVLRWNRVLEALGEDTGTGATAMTVEESRVNEGLFMFSRWDRVTRTLEAIATCGDPPPPPPPDPEISIAGGAGVVEGGSASFTLTSSPAPAAALTVDVTVAQQGDFGVAAGSRQVTVSTAGTGSLSVATAGDSVDEPGGSVTVTVDDGASYTVSATAGTASVAVSDDDDPPPPPVCVPNLPSDAVTVSEVRGWRDAHSGAAHVLRWNRVLEALGEDTGTGATPMTVEESRANEGLFMASRWDRVTRTLEAMAACDNPPPPPPPPEISITAGSSVVEGGNAEFTLTANPVPASPLTVDVTVSSSGDFGVTTGSRQVTTSTSGTGSLSVSTSDDSVDEADGSVTVTVDDGNGYTVSTTSGTASVAVSDDDDPPPPPPEPEIGIAAGNGITEGGSATFTLTASPAPSAALTVDVTVAQQGSFGVTTGSRQVTIPASGSVTLSVDTSGDSVDEPDGSVTVTVDDGAGYTVSATADTATVAVTDDDDPPATRLPPSQVSFSAEDASATEGDTLRFRVMLSNAANARVRVYWRTRYSYVGEHSAYPDRDYPSRERGWLAFDPGDTEKWVSITLPDDTATEPSEVFQIYLGFTEGGATIADRDAIMTIHDND